MKQTLLCKLKEDYSNAEGLIRTGNVLVNDKEVFIPSTIINKNDKITIKKQKEYVSRGAYKLLKGIEHFNLDFNNKVILDIGSSTGGFTEVSLLKGASHVYALDVGTNQLDYSLRRRDDVTTLEKTNLKLINKEMFEQHIDIVVCDVSFISLKAVFEVIKDLDIDYAVLLIKPQFEANSDQILKGGFAPKEIHEEVIEKVKTFAEDNNFVFKGYVESPIKGTKSKNIEYISVFEFKKA